MKVIHNFRVSHFYVSGVDITLRFSHVYGSHFVT